MIETLPFDAAEYLVSPESQVELIADALESGDASYVAVAIGIVARARGMSMVAKEAGVTREALYKALSPKGDPRLTTLLGVMKALGVKLSADIDQRGRGDRLANKKLKSRKAVGRARRQPKKKRAV